MIFIFYFMMYTLNSFAQKIHINWSQSFHKEIHFECSNDQSLCSLLCENTETCTITESICRNCIGTDLIFLSLIKGMGILYQNSGQIVDEEEFVHFLKNNLFVTIGINDVYNTIDPYEGDHQHFHDLCFPDFYQMTSFQTYKSIGESVVLFVKLQNESYEIVEPKFVYCIQGPKKGDFYKISRLNP